MKSRMNARAWSIRFGAVLLTLTAFLGEHVATGQEKVLQVSESDLRRAAIQRVEPEYPAVARQIRLTGDVELEISVDTAGSVDGVAVRSGNTLLVGSSVQAVRRWKFNPFRADGQPVKAVGPIRFNFQM